MRSSSKVASIHHDPTYLEHNNCDPISAAMGQEGCSPSAYINGSLMSTTSAGLENVLNTRPSDAVKALAQYLQDHNPKYSTTNRDVSIVYELPMSQEDPEDTQRVEINVQMKSQILQQKKERSWDQVGALPVFGLQLPSVHDLYAVTEQAKELNAAHVHFVFCQSDEALFIDGRLFVGDGCVRLAEQLGFPVPFDDVCEKIMETIIDTKVKSENCTLLSEAVDECSLKSQLSTSMSVLRMGRNDDSISLSLLSELNASLQEHVASIERAAVVLISMSSERIKRMIQTMIGSFMMALAKKAQSDRLQRFDRERKELHASVLDRDFLDETFQSLTAKRKQFCERRRQRDAIRKMKALSLEGEDRLALQTLEEERAERRTKQDEVYDRLVALERTRASIKIQAMMRGYIARKRGEKKKLFSASSRVSTSEAPPGIDPKRHYGQNAHYAAMRAAIHEVHSLYKDLFTASEMKPPPPVHTVTQYRHCANRIPREHDEDISSEDEFFEPVETELKERESLKPEHLLPNPHQMTLKVMEDGGYDERRFVYNAKTLHHGFPAVQRRALQAVQEMVLLLLNIVYVSLALRGHYSTKNKSFSRWMETKHSHLLKHLRHQHFAAMCTSPTGVPVVNVAGPSFSKDWVIGESIAQKSPAWVPPSTFDWECDFSDVATMVGSSAAFLIDSLPVLIFNEPCSVAEMETVINELTNEGKWTAAMVVNTLSHPTAFVQGKCLMAVNRLPPRNTSAPLFANGEMIVRPSQTPASGLPRGSTLLPRPPKEQRDSMITPNVSAGATPAAMTPKPPTTTRLSLNESTEIRDRSNSMTVEAADMIERHWMGVSWLEMERKLAQHLRATVQQKDGQIQCSSLSYDEHGVLLVQPHDPIRLLKGKVEEGVPQTQRSLAEIVTKHVKRKTMATLKNRDSSDLGGNSSSFRSQSPPPIDGASPSGPQQTHHGRRISNERRSLGAVSENTEEFLHDSIRSYTDGTHNKVFLHKAMRVRTCRLPTKTNIDDYIESISFLHKHISEALDTNASASVLCVGMHHGYHDVYAVMSALIATSVAKKEDLGFVAEIEAIIERMKSPVSHSIHLTDDDGDDDEETADNSFVPEEPQNALSEVDEEEATEEEEEDEEQAWLDSTGLVAKVKSRSKSITAATLMPLLNKSAQSARSAVTPLEKALPAPAATHAEDIVDESLPLPLRTPACFQRLTRQHEADLSRSGIDLQASINVVNALLVKSRLYHLVKQDFDTMMSANNAHQEGFVNLPSEERRRVIKRGFRSLQMYAVLVFFHTFLRCGWHATLPALAFHDFMAKHPFLHSFLDAPDPFDLSAGPRFCLDPFYQSYTTRSELWKPVEFASEVM